MDLNADSKMNNTLDQDQRNSSKSFESASKSEKEVKIVIHGSSIQVSKGEDQNRSSCGGEKRDDEVSPQELALAIDLIFECVLSFMDCASLFKCRKVSHRWRQVSTKVIKKGNKIQFRIDTGTAPGGASLRGRGQTTVHKLTSFLEETYTLLTGPFHLSTFLCNSIFLSDSVGLDDLDLQTFLNLYGKHLQYFAIINSSISEATSESQLIKRVEHLVTQMPNLQSLTLRGIQLTEETAGVSCESTNRSSPASSLEPMDTKATIIKATKLKFLTVTAQVSGRPKCITRKFIDFIVAISPNLVQIQVEPKFMHVLFEPKLLHYVKIFGFYPSYYSQATFEFLEAAIFLSPQERQLQNLPRMKFGELCVHFNEIDYYNESDENIRLRFVRLINKILESSWDTLGGVHFYGHTEMTLKGLRWPRVLPKVTSLGSGPKQSCGLEIFPLDGTFRIQDTFPGLKEIYWTVDYDNIRDSSEAEFLRKRNLGPLNTSRTEVLVRILVGLETENDPTWERDAMFVSYSESLLHELCPLVEVHSGYEVRGSTSYYYSFVNPFKPF